MICINEHWRDKILKPVGSIDYLPMFSTSFGIKNTTTTINPTIKPIGLFTIDITEKGSLICNQIKITCEKSMMIQK